MNAVIPAFETERLEELVRLDLLDSPADPLLDELVELFGELFGMPMSFISLIDHNRQWIKSRVGLDVDETPREISFCQHAIAKNKKLIVPDARTDKRFAENPLVTDGPRLRSYMGIPLRGLHRMPIGTLCVAGTSRRKFSDKEIELAERFAKLVTRVLIPETAAAAENDEQPLLTNDPFLDAFKRKVLQSRREGKNLRTALFVVRVEVLGAPSRRISHRLYDEIVSILSNRVVGLLQERMKVAAGTLDGGYFAVAMNTRKAPDAIKRIGTRLQKLMTLAANTSRGRYHPTARVAIMIDDGSATSTEQMVDSCKQLLVSPMADCADVVVHSPKKARHHARMAAAAAELPGAIDDNKLELFYQPICDLRSGQISGMEGLVRWKSPGGGALTASQILRLAENGGLMQRLDTANLGQACTHARSWNEHADNPIRVAVNIDSGLLLNPGFVRRIKRILETSGLEPSLLELEITEHRDLEDTDRAAKNINTLKDMGVSLSLDDFGTGYCSLSYLQRLPIDRIKLDRSFVVRLIKDPTSATLTQAIVSAARQMDLPVIAEGVETHEQLIAVRTLGCDYVQGYLIGRPMCLNRAQEFIDGFAGIDKLQAVRSAQNDDSPKSTRPRAKVKAPAKAKAKARPKEKAAT